MENFQGTEFLERECLLGFIAPSGKLTKNIRAKTKTKFDRMLSLKESHSMADMLWNHGLEWASVKFRFPTMKRSSWLKALIVAAPAIDSAK